MAKADSDAPIAKAPIVLTMGDPAGIGPDITLAAFAEREKYAFVPFYVRADAGVLEARIRQTGADCAVQVVEQPRVADTAWHRSVVETFSSALPVVHTSVAAAVSPGTPDPANGAATISSIDAASADIKRGFASAIVTNPIAKDVLYKSGFTSPGHTEYLAEIARREWRQECTPVMMLVAEEMRVVPLTIHVPLRDVAGLITPELISGTVRVVACALQRDFGIARPRIACTGLNPHAGENGTIGREDADIIAPTLEALRTGGIDVEGPVPGDTIFHAAARERFDVIVAMYHDQALIPIKTLAFDRGVNVTLGLPFVRTSPDHGTAFGIAGSGEANPRSLVEAIRLAHEIAARRRRAKTP